MEYRRSPVLFLGGHEIQSHSLRDRPAQEFMDGMRQPARGFHELFQGSPIRPPQQAQDPGCLTALTGPVGRLGLFSGLLAFGPRFGELAFFRDLGLPAATRALCGATWARLVAFGGGTVAAA
jgi:hypothetical protein